MAANNIMRMAMKINHSKYQMNQKKSANFGA